MATAVDENSINYFIEVGNFDRHQIIKSAAFIRLTHTVLIYLVKKSLYTKPKRPLNTYTNTY